jgi:photosystem II stability/assembly factor-like uncharacterized protein
MIRFITQNLLVAAITILLSLAVSGQWTKQDVPTKASLRGLSVVNEKVIWASGTGGTVIRTTDGGKNWNVIQVPDAEKLDFRDIEAFEIVKDVKGTIRARMVY